jgi:hypothetical protein
MRHAAGNMQRPANMQRANRQHAPDFQQHAADNNVMQRNMQHATGNVQYAACNVHMQQTT